MCEEPEATYSTGYLSMSDAEWEQARLRDEDRGQQICESFAKLRVDLEFLSHLLPTTVFTLRRIPNGLSDNFS